MVAGSDYVLGQIVFVFCAFCGVCIQAGDQIVRVNGLILSESTHEEFLNLMKLRKTYTLTLKGKSTQLLCT